MGQGKRLAAVVLGAIGLQAVIILLLTGGDLPIGGLDVDLMADQTPREQYNSLIQQSADESYHVTYTFTTEMLDTTGGVRNIEVYSHNGVRKSVATTSSFGSSRVQAQFWNDNVSVYCEERRSDLDCRLADRQLDLRHSILERAATNMTLNRTGQRTVAGRRCTAFTGHVPVQTFTDTVLPRYGDTLTLQFCLDNRKGYMALLMVNKTQQSAIGDSTTNIFTLRATSHDDDVTADDVTVPVPAVVSASCRGTPTADVVILQDTRHATLAVNGENRSIPAATWKEQTVNLTGLADGTNTVTVYTENGAATDTCYRYTYDYRDRSYDKYGFPKQDTAETSDVDLDQYTLLPDRIANGGFEDAEMVGNESISIAHWNHTNSNTNYLKVADPGIDGQSVRTGWMANSASPTPASVSQAVNLTDVAAIGLDVQGSGGTPFRAKIVLAVDGEREGTFIEAPQKNELYEDLGVELSQDYKGTHMITVKWVHISADNLGGSLIDNVRAYR